MGRDLPLREDGENWVDQDDGMEYSTFVHRDEERLRWIPREIILPRIASTLGEDFFLTQKNYHFSSCQVSTSTPTSQKARPCFNVPPSSIARNTPMNIKVAFQLSGTVFSIYALPSRE